MKKKAVLIAVLSLILLIAVILVINRESSPSYLRIIELNWNISFPINCEEIYQIDSGASFHGDGLRYHVFKYDADITLNDFIPEQEISEDNIERISNVLSSLHVKNEFYPDFNNITLGTVQKQSDNSKLYLCYTMSQRTLYVIEDIY